MKVIGAGFGRTGTDSMREALNLLGVGPCHHMREVLQNDAQMEAWKAIATSEGPHDWDAILQGYTACVDWPTAAYWPELIAHWPDAKVLLTWRDGESWWRSLEKTILPVVFENPDQGSLGKMLVNRRVFGDRMHERDHAIAVYESNVRRVKSEVAEERLLIYPIGAGWEPLCTFLDLPVPDVPFPHANTTADFNKDETIRPGPQS